MDDSRAISVIVSTYSIKRANDVVACMQSLANQTLPPKEIILVLDPDKMLLDFYKALVPHVKIIISEGYGLSKARNTGVKKAQGDIVAFIDDDAVAAEEWLAKLANNYANGAVAGVGGLIKPKWDGERPFWFSEELDWIVGCSYNGLPKLRALVRNPIGCNMSFRKNVFEKVGFFKVEMGRIGKKLLAGEEVEFSLRVMKTMPGSIIIFDPSAIVCHRVPRRRTTLGYLAERSFYEGFSKAMISSFGSGFQETLSTEDSYLEHLLRIAFPSRIKRIYHFECAVQLISMLISTSFVLIGYALGRLTRGLGKSGR